MKRGQNMDKTAEKYKRKKMIIIIGMTCIICSLNTFSIIAKGATNYITRYEFLKMVIEELKLSVDKTLENPYLAAAIEHGLISKSTFGKENNKALTRSDAAIVLTNAHQYLYEESVNDNLIKLVMSSRISDINKIKNNTRKKFMAKAFALGYITGNSDGKYSRTRTLNPNGKVTKKTAELFIERLLNPASRTKMTEDAQVIRTKNLPKYADKYEYILDSFPNEFYDWDFYFMRFEKQDGTKLYLTDDYEEGISWAYPKSIKEYGTKKVYYTDIKTQELMYGTTLELLENCKESWLKNVEDFLNLVFNVNYKTLSLNNKWYNSVWSLVDETNRTKFVLDTYIKAAVENKTIIECDKVIVDSSAIYCYNGLYMVRCYVHYKINSAKSIKIREDLVSPLIFDGYNGNTYIMNYKQGEWRDGYFDIEVATQSDNLGVRSAILCDDLYCMTEK